MRYLFLSVFFAAAIFADEFEEDIPLFQETKTYKRGDLKAVILIPDKKSMLRIDKPFSGFESYDVDVPGGVSRLNQKLSPKFLGEPLSQDTIKQLQSSLILYFQSVGRPFVVVEAPEQNVSAGVVQIIVSQGRIGEISATGNKYFPSSTFLDGLRQKPGEIIDTSKLMNDIGWMNRNAYHRTDLVFSPGAQPDTSDIQLVTKDRFPFRFYAGGDNTGNSSTGNARWYAGVETGNAFLLDHTLLYQFTMGSQFQRFNSQTVHYTAPLPWRHIFILYGGYAKLKPRFGEFKGIGKNAQASARYTIPWPPLYTSLLKEFTIGYDFKQLNNNLQFTGASSLDLITQLVNISQFNGSFSLGKKWKCNQLSIQLDGFWSPGPMLAHQQNSRFEELHPGAKNRYLYGQLSIQNTLTLPANFVIWTMARGQASTQNLLPSEQFGLGGYNTVRGYIERIFNADNTVCANLELRLPSFSVLGWFKRKSLDQLTILGFVDYGAGSNTHLQEAEPSWQHLLGVGPGIRYQISQYLSFRWDWGFRLKGIVFEPTKGNRFHLGMTVSY